MSLSVNEFVTLTSRLNAAEQRAACATDALQNALADIEKMRSWASETLLTSATVKLPADECPCASEDRSYFESYGHYSIHEEMLKDRVRTNSYRDAIFNNREMFRDKVVLDVGCGTGILCMFAASAGAKLVIGVDQSDIIYQAMDIVRENGFKDSITLLKGKMEEVELPVDKVDIIISEWMGYFLLYESMLDTVLWARDHYLAPGGHIMPDLCHLYIAGVSDVDTYQKRYAFWDDVYGFRMTCMKSAVTAEADVTIVDASKVVTESCLVKEISVATCKTTDLEFSCKLTLVAKSSGQLTAVVGFFDIEFCALDTKVSFSTSPSAIPTHWKQTVFLLEKPITVTAGDTLTGNLQCRKNRSDPRSLRITLTIDGHFTATYVMQ
jgi:protein arginine N-methyltransferase 3